MRDMYSEETIESLIAAAVKTGDTNGASLDLKGYESATIVVSIGITDTTIDGSNMFEFELEESDDDSSFTDVAAADTIGEVSGTNTGCFGVVDTSTEGSSVHTVHYIGSKQYVRPVINVTGTMDAGAPISAVGIKRGYKYPPA